jgi:putative resolvase
MKLSTYARQIGVTYKTAYRWWKAGKLDAYQMDTGTVIFRDSLKVSTTNVALYAHVLSGSRNDL